VTNAKTGRTGIIVGQSDRVDYDSGFEPAGERKQGVPPKQEHELDGRQVALHLNRGEQKKFGPVSSACDLLSLPETSSGMTWYSIARWSSY